MWFEGLRYQALQSDSKLFSKESAEREMKETYSKISCGIESNGEVPFDGESYGEQSTGKLRRRILWCHLFEVWRYRELQSDNDLFSRESTEREMKEAYSEISCGEA